MIQIGGTLNIELTKTKFKFGKLKYTGKSEKNVIMALFKELYDKDEDKIIRHILDSKAKNIPINFKNTKGIAEIVHNYQYSSKDVSNFVKVFKSLNTKNRLEVLTRLNIRNLRRDEDCKSYTIENHAHRELVDIGIKQLEELQRIHDLLELPKESKLHVWLSPSSIIIKKGRLSKKEKKELKKQTRKSKKKLAKEQKQNKCNT